MNELERIVARVRADLHAVATPERRRRLEQAATRREKAGEFRDFAGALGAPERLTVIAEHKRRSPSAGLIREDLELAEVVSAYERGGAAALSVLTERHRFGGSLADLEHARQASSLPILRKDFILDELQILEALAHGADAILLIVAALPAGPLAALHAFARRHGLAVLTEVHDERELDTALGIGAEIIGINNRDLTTLKVDTARTPELLARVPPGPIIVAESGYRTAEQMRELREAGADAVLIGEALMRSADLAAALGELIAAGSGGAASGRP